MVWNIFNESKGKLRKAAKTIIDSEDGVDSEDGKKKGFIEVTNAYKILSDYRSSYAYPVQSMFRYFRKKALEVDKKAITVRRLKRQQSIISKLRRFPKMRVDRMQDIGGIRIIVEDIEKISTLKSVILKGRTKNILKKEYDYIEKPKESGYRGVHLVYFYKGDKEEYKNYLVELQIRSAVQHAWATTVEVMGTFSKENLKAGIGNQEWLDFFKKVSHAFACMEEGRLNDYKGSDEQRDLQNNIEHLNVIAKLESYTIASMFSDKKERKEGYYLLILNVDKGSVRARHYENKDLEQATEDYRVQEQDVRNDINKDALLVSAKSIRELKKAYPNYFADTKLFIKKLSEVIQ